MNGLGFVRGDFVPAVASLNKMELLPWDCWGVILNEQLDDPADLAVLDEVATLITGDAPDLETVRARYESDPCFHMNSTLLSYVNGDMVQVNVA